MLQTCDNELRCKIVILSISKEETPCYLLEGNPTFVRKSGLKTISFLFSFRNQCVNFFESNNWFGLLDVIDKEGLKSGGIVETNRADMQD